MLTHTQKQKTERIRKRVNSKHLFQWYIHEMLTNDCILCHFKLCIVPNNYLLVTMDSVLKILWKGTGEFIGNMLSNGKGKHHAFRLKNDKLMLN